MTKSAAELLLDLCTDALPDWWSVEVHADFGAINVRVHDPNGYCMHIENEGLLEEQLRNVLVKIQCDGFGK